ncbi:MAG: M20/M25/M40 family metallo-hydrolase [Anaerolineales bacterium]|nr:M20/M25/M40 family metallo-hydrolase [Anaerolineales bacterium]
MQIVKEIAERPAVRAALEMLRDDLADTVALIERIQQVPAPTFAEGPRADLVEQEFANLGLQDIWRDELNNVYGRMPGRSSNGPGVIVSAHLDTVFPAGSDLTVTRENGRVHGPGIADNSAGVGGMLAIIDCLRRFELQPEQDVWFVANVGEEGLGDLNGMRAVVAHFGQGPRYIVLEGGLFGQILHRAIAVQRFTITVETGGGHSWKNFGRPSAIHVLGQLIAAISDLIVPVKPFTTFNVGLIEGGTSINTIAPSATMWLDLRSEDNVALAEVLKQVKRLVHDADNGDDVRVHLRQIGDRPAGEIPVETPLVQMAAAALQAVGLQQANFTCGSTDANIPLSRGYEAVCIGLTKAENVHRLDEYMETSLLARGLGQLLLLLLAAAS